MRISSALSVQKLIGAIVLTLVAQTALAKPPQVEKLDVLRQAKNYAQAIACSTTFSKDSEVKTDINDVHLIESTTDYDGGEEFGTKYIVEWGGDIACLGGSGTYMGFITSFSRFSQTRPFVVEHQNIIIDDMDLNGYDLNPRFIEDVSYNNDKLYVTSSEYGNDGSNSPRYKYIYTITYADYAWKVVNRKLIADLYKEYR